MCVYVNNTWISRAGEDDPQILNLLRSSDAGILSYGRFRLGIYVADEIGSVVR